MHPNPKVDFQYADDPLAVAAKVSSIARTCFGRSDEATVRQLFENINELFRGGMPPYLASDMAYHDLEHSMQVVLCWSAMFQTLQQTLEAQSLAFDEFFIGVAACLLHDSGYLKEKGDSSAVTGAKYALVHETRSCLIARHFLSTIDWEERSIKQVQRMIAATGPRAVIAGIPFASPLEKRFGQMLATADFLAQMADPQYLNKLPSLFKEFEEFDRLRGLSQTERPFPNLDSLFSGTPRFWYQFVLPRLKVEYEAAYRLLNRPYPDGPNAYLQQAEANIEAIQMPEF